MQTDLANVIDVLEVRTVRFSVFYLSSKCAVPPVPMKAISRRRCICFKACREVGFENARVPGAPNMDS